MAEGDYEYRDALSLPGGRARGRGAGLNPGNRYESVRLHVLGEHLDDLNAQAAGDASPPCVRTQVIPDRTKSLINYVDPAKSPDIGFRWTINPYRGCEHGCIYCYARPDHERLGMSCGLDFETKIVAKYDAPKLLRKELADPKWKPEPIVMSGVTDCYQPIERELRITRGCMEVFAEARQPVSIVTKNRLILRDLDLLTELAQCRAVHVAVSVTTLDLRKAAVMEPRASSPADRLHTIRTLAQANIPVTAMIAPIIPGLTDREVPSLLRAVADAGALNAGYVLLRLPYQIKDLFLDWLRANFPDRAAHVETLVRDTRNGKLYDAAYRVRHRGAGPVAEQINSVFKVFKRRYRLDRSSPPMSTAHFIRPSVNGQGNLFS